MEQKASIKFCVKLSKTFPEMLEMLRIVHTDQVLSRTTVYEWFKRFKEGRESLDEDEHSERPASSRTDILVEKFEN